MKRRIALLLLLGVVLLSVADRVWARGHGGHGHGVAQGGHASPFGPGRGAGNSLASGSPGFHTLSNCPARLHEGAFCPLHGLHAGGTFYPAEGPPQGAPESDLGPWWIFLYLGRGVVRGLRWLTAS